MNELTTLAAEQEKAHVVAEGAADVVAAVGQGAGQTAAVEGAKGVRAEGDGEEVIALFADAGKSRR